MIDDLLRIVKRRANSVYTFEVFKPFLDAQESGFWVSIGSGAGAKLLLAIPVFVCISGDHAELYKLIGSSFLKLSYKCRICKVPQVEDIGADERDDIRNDAATMTLSQEAGMSYKNRLLKAAKSHYDQNLINRELEKGCMIENVAVQWEPNELYKLFMWPKLLPSSDVPQLIGLHEAMVPDILHNFLKGSMQDSVAWTQSILECIQKMDTNYCYSISHLDHRLKNFPRRQALEVFPVIWVSKVISEYFKNTTNKNTATQSAGFGGGILPAWKYPSMTMQLLFSLGGDLLPSTDDWWTSHFGNETQANPVPVFKVGQVVTNALISNLEVWWWLSSDTISELNLASLSTLIRKLRLCMLHLYTMKFHLTKKAFNKSTDYVAQRAPPYRGIKHHMLEHTERTIRNFGAKNSGIDTQVSERSHKQSKEAFAKTNKQYATASRDMLRSIITRNAILDFQFFREELQPKEIEVEEEEDEEVEEESAAAALAVDEDAEDEVDDDRDDTNKVKIDEENGDIIHPGQYFWNPQMSCEWLVFRGNEAVAFRKDKGDRLQAVKEIQGIIPPLSISQILSVLRRKCTHDEAFIDQCDNEPDGKNILKLIKRGLQMDTDFIGDTDISKTKVDIALMRRLGNHGDKKRKMKPFNLYASSKFSRKRLNSNNPNSDQCNFSFVELNYAGYDPTLARVACMLSFEATWGERASLCVCYIC
jgi:hypothetical protein